MTTYRLRGDDRMIQLKSPREIAIMARGGRILGETLRLLASRTVPGVTTGELDRLAEDFIRSHDGAEPAFKGLYGFPGSTCLSVNQEIVHGIPSPKRALREGDILSIDVGVKYEGRRPSRHRGGRSRPRRRARATRGAAGAE